MIALNVSYAKKEKIIYPAYASKHNSNHGKKNNFFNDFKLRRMALYCNRKITCIIKKNNVKKL